MKVGKKKIELSATSAMHYYKLFARSALILVALALYVFGRIENDDKLFGNLERYPQLVAVITLLYAVEIVLRFIPSKIESMGCQKQFKRNYYHVGTDIPPDRKRMDRGLWAVVASWLGLNGIFGALYLAKVLDWAEMLLLCQVYAVCDMICILFFCPFQTWFLKNKCCSTCRIYNWDYAMMFTPLFFVRDFYAWSLFGVSLILMLRWEVTFYRHPERFSEETNEYIRCEGCTEKLCAHKDQLQ